MSVFSNEHLDKLAFILYDRPAGRNIIGYAIEKIEQLRAGIERLRSANKQLVEGIASITRNKNEEIERLRAEMQGAKADAWDEGYQDHQAMIEGIARKPSNPYR